MEKTIIKHRKIIAIFLVIGALSEFASALSHSGDNYEKISENYFRALPIHQAPQPHPLEQRPKNSPFQISAPTVTISGMQTLY